MSPRRALQVGLPLAVALAAVSLLGRATWYQQGGGTRAALARALDVDTEGSIPTYLSAVGLLLCAGTLWMIADELRARRHRWSWQWRLLALVFLYLSVDEMVSLHELAIRPVRDRFDLDGILYYSWVVVAVPLVVALVVVLVPFLRALPGRTVVGFLLSGTVFMSGAVGLELLGGLVASSGGSGTLRLHAVVTVEELLEMVGTVLFLAAVNEYRCRALGTPVLRPTSPDSAS